MKKSSLKQYAISLWQATHELEGKELDAIIANFASLLARERMLKKTPAIIANYVGYAKFREGIEDVEITSARALTDKVLDSLKKTFGKKIEMSLKIDSSLIGGVVVRAGDKLIDASVKTQLNKLKQSLA